jgi:hypothetical protein
MSDPADQPIPRDTLPIPDYDHLPVGSLTHRIRSLDSGGLGQLIDYERAHGARVPVLQVLEARRDALERGAEPSGGDPLAAAGDVAPPAPGASAVSPQTAGPVLNPPSHGVPTNPAQPRSTG